MFRIGKVFLFEAAHHLPHHDGKCRHPHGHSYRVDVMFVGELDREDGSPKRGMLLDFGDVSTFWKAELHPLLDHRDLNKSLAGKVIETTAECLAQFIYDTFVWGFAETPRGSRRRAIKVEAVKVYETVTSFAEYRQ